MLFLCVNGEIKEFRVEEIAKITPKDNYVTIRLKKGEEISVDDTEEMKQTIIL